MGVCCVNCEGVGGSDCVSCATVSLKAVVHSNIARGKRNSHSKLCDSNPSLSEYQSNTLTNKPLTTLEALCAQVHYIHVSL